jgi:membrane associated rhomboid family serine protease
MGMNQRSADSGSLKDELRTIVRTLAVCLGILWVLELTDVWLLGGMLDGFGIRPRETFGLIGVLTWPLLHGGLAHLLSNTLAMLLFGTLVLMWGRREFLAVTAVSTIVGGLGVWLVGATGSVHVGASGVCFGYFGYLLARGFYERKFGSVLLSVVIAVLFGGTLAGAVPGLSMPGISWEGHLFGLIGGILVARRFKNKKG